MSTGLPENLFHIYTQRTPESPPVDAHEIRLLRYQTLAQFWRISFVRYFYTRTPAAKRAENIFWRLWGDRFHRESIDESGIEELCTLCQQPFNFVPFDLAMPCKTTSECAPVHHYDGKQSLRNDRATQLEPKRNFEQVSDGRAMLGHGIHQELKPKSEAPTSNGSRPKASRSASSQHVSTRTNLNPRDRPGTTLMGTTKKTKRPTLGRRINSSSQYIKAPKSPSLGSKQSQKDEGRLVAEKYESKTKDFELPSASSWEDEISASGSRPISPTATPEVSAGLGIDPDFRNKFAERVASSSSLALPSRMRKSGSIVRFAIEPLDAVVDGIANEVSPQAAVTADPRPLLAHRLSTSSVAVSDEDDIETQPTHLPRTRSQLSFLISERRATHGEEFLRGRPDAARSNTTKKEAEDAEILAMAQRQGVTKAGGIQVPQQHRIDKEIESRYSSPDRDNTF